MRHNSLQQSIQQGAQYLQQGRLVAFPTETVYGLGANAWDAAAVQRIFAAKGRPADNPLIVHIAHTDMLSALVENVPAAARELMDVFWPGPLSLVMPRSRHLPDIVTAGLDTVAVRWPNHPVAEELILQAALPVAAPSANRSGRPSPTLAAHVAEDLGARVDLIIDAGMATIGLESTVLDVSRAGAPVLLRPGAVTVEDLQQVIGPVEVAALQPGQKVRSPGMKYKHYAPQAPLYLYIGEPAAVVQAQQERWAELTGEGLKVGILTYEQFLPEFAPAYRLSLGHYGQPAQAAQQLYHLLRQFDALGVDVILAHGYPSTEGLGLALQNRFAKAAGHRLIWI